MSGKAEKRTRHAATDPRKCEEMARRYGWELIDIEPRDTGVMKVDCVFKGDAQFPKSNMDLTQGDETNG